MLIFLSILLMTLSMLEAQHCALRHFKNVSVGNEALRPSELISSHNIHRLGECHLLCIEKENCYGYNYRVRPSSVYSVNCQLSNRTKKWNKTTTKYGPWVYYEDVKVTEVSATSCLNLYQNGKRSDGIYTINPDGKSSFQVWCDMTTNGGGWTVFQRRQDASVDFFRGWSEYKTGFGSLNGNFWLGLENIFRMTKTGNKNLRIDLTDFDDSTAFALYSTFSLASESEGYKLNIGGFSSESNAGDSLTSTHNGMKFSTKDRDNDRDGGSCAAHWKGAWWYNRCHSSHLNGKYLNAGDRSWSGITWGNWKSDTRSMKKTEIKIR
ncbi:microfibril-associated glycoprotein 4-like [Dendronephthya gigantea]|uniref:microfibril-associated glycoprotein 4-like n=1 Tax=Dendronephthya gigantea TaxID=151771 RepID=UPI00106BAA0C|nr:microfibril-associated glycoprotein 4-like [Dendronephthya gigantea]